MNKCMNIMSTIHNFTHTNKPRGYIPLAWSHSWCFPPFPFLKLLITARRDQINHPEYVHMSEENRLSKANRRWENHKFQEQGLTRLTFGVNILPLHPMKSLQKDLVETDSINSLLFAPHEVFPISCNQTYKSSIEANLLKFKESQQG